MIVTVVFQEFHKSSSIVKVDVKDNKLFPAIELNFKEEKNEKQKKL